MKKPESRFEGLLPTLRIGETGVSLAAGVYLAPGSVVVGAVEIGAESSIWYGSVLRGDIQRISVGAQSNVQDGSVLHVADAFPCLVGERVSIGHRAVVHACTLGDEVLVGMGAIIMDGAEIGPQCIIGAGTVVPKGLKVPEGSLVLGTPGRIVRTLSSDERLANRRLALKYVALSRHYLALRQAGHSGV
jgi:carbonic anhydrase/acetyltransferase-like protein (isoleucine patch superfamily)